MYHYSLPYILEFSGTMGREDYLFHLPEMVLVGGVLPIFIGIQLWMRHQISKESKSKVSTRTHFRGHSVIWVASCMLLALLALRFIEGVLRATSSPGIKDELFIPYIVALLALPVFLVLYNHAEKAHSWRWLCVCVMYWLCIGAVTCIRLGRLPHPEQNVLVLLLSVELGAEVVLLLAGCCILLTWVRILSQHRPTHRSLKTKFSEKQSKFLAATVQYI